MGKVKGAVLLLLVGAFVAAAIELFIGGTTSDFAQRMEAFDSIIPVVSIGLTYLFTRNRS